MPQPAQQQGDDWVPGPSSPCQAAAQRQIQVVAQPGGQAHVPPAPELAGRAGKIRRAEIVREIKPHEGGQSLCHVRVAVKIREYLEGKGIGGQQHHEAAFRGTAVDPVHQDGQVVGHDDLFEEPEKDQVHSLVAHPTGHLPGRGDLGQQPGGAFDGTGDESRRTGRNPETGPWAPSLPVDVDGVAHALKRVKRNAHGQHDVKGGIGDRDAHGGQQGLKPLNEKIEILEKSEEPQVDGDAHPQPSLLGPGSGAAGDPGAGQVVDHGGKQDEGEKPVVPGRVEHVAGHQQDHVLPPMTAHPVGEIGNRKK